MKKNLQHSSRESLISYPEPSQTSYCACSTGYEIGKSRTIDLLISWMRACAGSRYSCHSNNQDWLLCWSDNWGYYFTFCWEHDRRNWEAKWKQTALQRHVSMNGELCLLVNDCAQVFDLFGRFFLFFSLLCFALLCFCTNAFLKGAVAIYNC